MFRITGILDVGSIFLNVTKSRVKSQRKSTVEELEGLLMTFSRSQIMLKSSQSMKGLFVVLIESAMRLIVCISGHIIKS